MKKTLLSGLLLGSMAMLPAHAADYQIDYQGAHASINFKVKHLGYSWLTGRFNKFDGQFSYDADNVEASKITVNIDTASVDSNHAERDKHLRNDDFLDVEKFSTASFVSKKVIDKGDNKLDIIGDLTLQGITKELIIEAEKIGEGEDPWGGYRAGFAGTTSIEMKDFGYKMDFGEIIFDLHIEGIRQ
ncbi:YceI family protein [Thalassotalea maritima]|uniref:YceI family protein n=1 Tax=Thalassotalea maritima TaxID=3242416 RepID=UPI00352926C8